MLACLWQDATTDVEREKQTWRCSCVIGGCAKPENSSANVYCKSWYYGIEIICAQELIVDVDAMVDAFQPQSTLCIF